MIDGEELPPAAAARVVNDRYRLHAADLHGRAVQAQIVNVSLQGVEELQVVLHLSGFVKPLLLTPEQRQALLQLMQGGAFEQWIDQCITLRPRRIGNGQTIEISAAQVSTRERTAVTQPARVATPPVTNFLTGLFSAETTVNSYAAVLFILLVLGLLFGAAYLIENPEAWRTLLGQ